LGGLALTSLAALPMLLTKPTDKLNQELKNSPSNKNSFPNVELINHMGQRVRFYDDLIKDKFVVINMMYAQCSEGVCPISTYNLRKVQQALGTLVGSDIHMYSISLLPDFDTPKVLNKYAKANKVGNGWQFLTGQYNDIELIRRRLGFYDMDPAVDADKTQHAGMVRIGSDRFDRWLMAPALGGHESILQVIDHAFSRHIKSLRSKAVSL
jgi:protein SCO1/2